MRPVTPLLLLLALSACTWVGKEDFEARLPELDDDADGFSASDDCDDGDASINPAVEETWHDGIDQRCDGGDDYDQDGDGFVADEHVGLPTAGVAGTGALPGGDCDDTLAGVAPGQADAWYDGLDTNCDGLDDFDQDADGYVSNENVGKTTQYVETSGALPGGDCDDLLASIGPDVSDAWYDGVDTNCDGADDYDQDADGYASDEHAYGPTEYASGTGSLAATDCNDGDDEIKPGAGEIWYDAVDQDCAGDDDFDQDADGFSSDGHGGTDCDDVDPVIFPGSVETLGDFADGDCDGDVDTFAVSSVAGYTWVGPRAPTFDENGGYIYLAIASEEISISTTRYYDSALALRWESADPADGQDSHSLWQVSATDNADFVLGAGLGFQVSGGYIYGLTSLDYGDGRALRFTRYDLSSGARSGIVVEGADGLMGFDDIALALDGAGNLHALGCEDETEVMHYVRVPAAYTSGADADLEVAGVSAADCSLWVGSSAGGIYTSEQGGVWEYPFTPSIASTELLGAEYSSAYAPLDLDIPSDWAARTLVMADATSRSGVLFDGSSATVVAPGDFPTEIDAVEDAAGTLYVAYVNPAKKAHLTWGTPGGTLEDIQLAVPFDVDDVAVWVSGAYVMYAAVGEDQVAVGIARI